MKKLYYQILLLFLAGILLMFPQYSVEGARNGLLLWSGTIVPTLLPFLLLTGFMNKYQTLHYVSWLFFPIYRKYPTLNRDLAYTLVLGFFCGYPLGGKIINDLVLSGSYTKKEGQCLLAVCNNVSPMFTIGYTLTLILHSKVPIPVFFLCLYTPNICYLFFTFVLHSKRGFFHTHQSNQKFYVQKTMDEIIFDSLHSIFTIGIYIMIFSIGANLLTAFHPFSVISDFAIGCLEITTGITHFGALALNSSQKITALCAISSFGGLCSIAQTGSVCQKSGLSMISYTITKAIFACISGLFAFLLF